MIYFLSSNIRKLKDISFLIKKYAMTYYLFLPWKINGFVKTNLQTCPYLIIMAMMS
jgi:hypothetical protein